MHSSDKHLVTLKLILKYFGLDVSQALAVNHPEPNQDLIACCLALLQSLYPLGYEYEVVKIGGRHRIRSTSLTNEVDLMFKRTGHGELIVLERQYALKDVLVDKIKKVATALKIPNETKFTQAGWLYLLGFYLIASEKLNEDVLLGILTNEYRDFLPYLDIANERIKELQFNG